MITINQSNKKGEAQSLYNESRMTNDTAGTKTTYNLEKSPNMQKSRILKQGMYVDMSRLRASHNIPKIQRLSVEEKQRLQEMKEQELLRYRQEIGK